MVCLAKGANIRLAAGLAVLTGALIAGSPVRADVPETSGTHNSSPQKSTSQTSAAAKPTPGARKPAATEEAISPRWIGPKWEIKGLTVWVFTPGHFEGR